MLSLLLVVTVVGVSFIPTFSATTFSRPARHRITRGVSRGLQGTPFLFIFPQKRFATRDDTLLLRYEYYVVVSGVVRTMYNLSPKAS